MFNLGETTTETDSPLPRLRKKRKLASQTIMSDPSNENQVLGAANPITHSPANKDPSHPHGRIRGHLSPETKLLLKTYYEDKEIESKVNEKEAKEDKKMQGQLDYLYFKTNVTPEQQDHVSPSMLCFKLNSHCLITCTHVQIRDMKELLESDPRRAPEEVESR